MIKIIILTLLFILYLILSKEKFIGYKMFVKPSVKNIKSELNIVPHNKKKQNILDFLNKINGYYYYVGGGLSNSYYTYGFKHSEIADTVNTYNFIYNHRKKEYDKFIIIEKSKLVPILSLGLKELNQITRNNIDKINDLHEKMFKLEEKSKKKIAKKNLG